MKQKKVVRSVIFTMALVGCCAGGYIAGSVATQGNGIESVEASQLTDADLAQAKVTASAINEETAAETDSSEDGAYSVERTAIINLDEGVKIGQTTVSYSSSLFGTLDVPYELTGLEDAKQGLNEGRYSAYMIIPAEFSAKAETINDVPEKANVQYVLSDNLTNEALATAMADVQEIYSALNDGLSEVYLASVLEQLHVVQDSSNTILNNDQDDMDLLNGITADDLNETIQLPELQTLENNIQLLDLTQEYETTSSLINSVEDAYSQASDAGQDDYSSLQSSYSEAEQQLSDTQSKADNLNEAVQNIDDPAEYEDTSAANNAIDEAIADEINNRSDRINEAVESCNQQLTANSTEYATYIAELEQIKAYYDNIEQQLSAVGFVAVGNPVNNEDQTSEHPYATTDVTYELSGQTYDSSKVQAVSTEAQALAAAYANDMTAYKAAIDACFDNLQTDANGAVDINALKAAVDNVSLPTVDSTNLQNAISDLNNSGNNSNTQIQTITISKINNIQKPSDSLITEVTIPTMDDPSASTESGEEESSSSSGQTTGDDSSSENTETDDSTSGGQTTGDDTSSENNENEDSSEENTSGTLSEMLETMTTNAKTDRSNAAVYIADIQTNYREDKEQLTASANELVSSMQTYSQLQDSYSEAADTYDPASYLDQETISTLESDLTDNTSSISNKVDEELDQYSQFVDEIYQNSQDNTDKQLESIESAEKASKQKLETTLSTAKEGKAGNADENKNILGKITQILPYSRLGTQENLLTYQFMVSPITLENLVADAESVQNETDLSEAAVTPSASAKKATVSQTTENTNEKNTAAADSSGTDFLTTLGIILAVILAVVLIVLFVVRKHWIRKDEL